MKKPGIVLVTLFTVLCSCSSSKETATGQNEPVAGRRTENTQVVNPNGVDKVPAANGQNSKSGMNEVRYDR